MRAHTERAQQGPSLAGEEVDAAGNQGGVNGTLFLAGLEALDSPLRIIDLVVADVEVDVIDAVAVVVASTGTVLLVFLLGAL